MKYLVQGSEYAVIVSICFRIPDAIMVGAHGKGKIFNPSRNSRDRPIVKIGDVFLA